MIDNTTPEQTRAIVNALKSLALDAAKLRTMKAQLRAVPAGFATFDDAERARQAHDDEKQIRKYTRAVRIYKRKVNRMARQIATA